MSPARTAGLVVAGATAIVGVAIGVLGVSAPRVGSSPAPRSAERSIGLFDAHLHLSVRDVHVVDALGGERSSARRRWVVTVRARSDAARIEIDPSGLAVAAESRDGRRFAPLEGVGSPPEVPLPTRLVGVLHPGETIERSFVFELPDDAPTPVVVIESSDGPLPWLPRGIVRLLGARVELGLS